jgi:hypothetical protein
MREVFGLLNNIRHQSLSLRENLRLDCAGNGHGQMIVYQLNLLLLNLKPAGDFAVEATLRIDCRLMGVTL